MRGSRDFCQAGGGGGGGGGGRGPTARKQSGQCFFSHQLILQLTEWIQWFYNRREEGVQLLPGDGGVQRNPYNLWFPGGGPDPLTPLWIRTWGRLTPLFAYRIMVYQNLNNLKNTTQRRQNWKKLSPADRDSKCGSRGGSGGSDPPGKSQIIWVSIGYKQLDKPWKKLDPPPPHPWKMLDPLWNHEKW